MACTYLPNSRTNMVIVLQELSLMFWHFINKFILSYTILNLMLTVVLPDQTLSVLTGHGPDVLTTNNVLAFLKHNSSPTCADSSLCLPLAVALHALGQSLANPPESNLHSTVRMILLLTDGGTPLVAMQR